jgi:hypothetical protein
MKDLLERAFGKIEGQSFFQKNNETIANHMKTFDLLVPGLKMRKQLQQSPVEELGLDSNLLYSHLEKKEAFSFSSALMYLINDVNLTE